MRLKATYWGMIVIGFLSLFALYQLYPMILFKVMEWQKNFNLQLSASLNELAENQSKAGITLVFISFFIWSISRSWAWSRKIYSEQLSFF